MATNAIKQITTGQRIMGGIAIFQPHDAQKLVTIGPVGATELAPAITEQESRSDESGVSQLIGKWITVLDGTITISDIQMWTPFLYDSLFLAKRTFFTQTALASGTIIVEDIAPLDAIEVPGINPTVTAVVDLTPSTPKTYTEDEEGTGDGNYTFHSQSKILQFVSKPSGATPDGKVTYSLPEITEEDGLVKLEIMKTGGTRGKLTILGVVGGGLPGQAVDYIFYDVEFRPNGNVPLKGVDALNVGSLTGTLYNTGGQGYGFIRPHVA